jgi:hypothetical protein
MMKRHMAILLGLVLLGLVASSTLEGKGKPGGKPGGDTPAGTVYYTYGSGNTQTWTMDADGSNKTALPAGVRGEPSHDLHGGHRWFLDRRAVNGTYPNGRNRSELFAVRDDGEATQLTASNTAFEVIWYARWSKDDASISWVARRWESDSVVEGGIYVAGITFDSAGDVTGLDAQPADPTIELTIEANNGNSPAGGGHDWAPDGKHIVYGTRATVASSSKSYVADLDDGSSSELASPAGGGVWSPDGAKIAFSTWGLILTINPDGTGETEIIKSMWKGANPKNTFHPLWAPTSGHLIYSLGGAYGDESARADIYGAAANGRGKTNLTSELDTTFMIPARPVGWR